MQIRNITDSERLQATKIVYNAFFAGRDPQQDLQDQREKEKNGEPIQHEGNWRFAVGAFDDAGKLLACMGVIPYEVIFDGNVTDMRGIGGVASLPEYRRGGNVRKIFEKVLNDAYNDGVAFSYLYPFSHIYYRKFGYELNYCRFVNDVQSEAFARFPQSGGEFREFDKSTDCETLKNIYDVYIADKNLALVRNENKWQKIFDTNPHKQCSFTYIYKNDRGVDAGYLIFERQGDVFAVQELCFIDSQAFLHLLGFLYSFGKSSIRITTPCTLDLRKVLHEQNEIQTTVENRGMNRIINLQKVLELTKINRAVTISVSDPMLKQNEGAWSVQPQDGKNVVKRISSECDIQTSIMGLTQLVTGYATVKQLELFGTLKLNDKKALDAFPLKDLFLNDYF